MAQTFTVPGMDAKDAVRVQELLQDRLTSLIDLELTLKHIHWNVVGPSFIGVHEMLDPQVDGVRLMVDTTAERIATMGGQPNGTPGFVARTRAWDDYSLGRAKAMEHLGALDKVYEGVIASHRSAIEALDALDRVSQEMVIGHTEQLEQYHWFVRAHLEDSGGRLSTADTTHEREAARAASRAASLSADGATSDSTERSTGRTGAPSGRRRSATR
jgi:starvation-inducible DNA-binding protein